MKKFILLLLTFLWVGTTYAQDGTLDQSFGIFGISEYDASIGGGGDTGRDVIGLEDGKLLASTSLRSGDNINVGVLRYKNDGTVDSSFAVNGRYFYPSTVGSDLPYEMMLDDEGNIYVCGGFALDDTNVDNISMGLFKLDAEGNLDTDFGDDGLFSVIIDSSQDYARDMLFTSSGQIILTGYSHTPGFNFKSNAVIRVNADGTLDETFGVDGKFVWQTEDMSSELYALLLDENDNIYTSGYTDISGGDIPVLYKILADGSGFDTSFGTDGAIIPPIEGRCTSLIWGRDGNIVGAGKADAAQGSDAFIYNMLTDGTLNPDFGNRDGYSTQNIAPLTYMHEVIQIPNGKYILGGEASAGFFGAKGFGSVRFLEDGEVDLTWGEKGDGTIVTTTGNPISFANGITMQPTDGKIVIIGTGTATANTNDLTLVRYNNNVDADGDGVDYFSDCDDNDADVYRVGTFFIDADGDGYDVGEEDVCYGEEAPDGYSETTDGEDCDDDNADIYRLATLFVDADGDGYDAGEEEVCYGENAPNGYSESSEGEDCDDGNANIYRLATLFIDNDGDGYDAGEEEVCYGENAPDGYSESSDGEDCDDDNAGINPGETDIPGNGVDEDCDGEDAVSVKETAFTKTFSVYPNPVSAFLTISNESNATIESISVFDNVGKTLAIIPNDLINSQSTIINTNDFPSGLLIIEITTSNGVVIKQVVKR